MKYYLDLGSEKRSQFEESFQKFKIAGYLMQKGEISELFEFKTKDFQTVEKINHLSVKIENPKDMVSALNLELPQNVEHIIIKTTDWHIIPIENLIAKFSQNNIKLIAFAKTPTEVELLKNILEIGISGIILKLTEEYLIEDLLGSAIQIINLKLIPLKVESVEKIGVGDRVCVDTCSILKQGEGMLVGSTASVMTLIEAEVEETGFVNSRPFRVNAGVVASYALNFEKTNYLSELQAGDSVMIVDREGKARSEKVARVKIERRPLVLIKVIHDSKLYPIILQDAETVKLVGPDKSYRVTDLKPGQTILTYITDKARHFGMEVDEFLEER